MDSKEQIGERIKTLREEKGLIQADVAKALNVKRETVNQWENGVRDLKTEYTVNLANYFNVTSDYILRGIKSENTTVNKELGLSDEAIEILKKLAEDFSNKEKIPQIKENITDNGCALSGADEEIYRKYLLDNLNKEYLKTINLLLSSQESLLIIRRLTNYFKTKPNEKIEVKGDNPGTSKVYYFDSIRGMHAQSIISAVQKFCDNYKGGEIYGEYNEEE